MKLSRRHAILGSAATLINEKASAWTHGAGGPVYSAKAVHFNSGSGASYLYRFYTNGGGPPGDPLLPNSTTGTFSLCFKTNSSGNPPSSLWFLSTYALMPYFDFNDSFSFLQALQIGLEIVGANYFIGDATTSGPFAANTWYTQTASWNTNFPQGSKICQIVTNGIALTVDTTTTDTTGAAPVQWSYNYIDDSGQALVIPDVPNDGDANFDCADIQFWDGVFIDLTIPANTQLFYKNGKPVNPAIAAAALGQQSLLFQRTSSDPATFAVNQGTAGSYNLVRGIQCTGSNGVGAVVLTGALIGDPVISIFDLTGSGTVNYLADFESTISANNQIQQTSASDLSGISLLVNLPGALTNASSNP